MQFYTKQSLRIYTDHLKRYKGKATVAVVMIVSAYIIGVLIPLQFKRFFDILAQTAEQEQIVQQLLSVLFTVFILLLAQWILHRVGEFSYSRFVSSTMKDLAQTCFGYLHKHSITFFNSTFVGSLVKKVNQFVWSFQGITDKILWDILRAIVNSTVILAVLFGRNMYLGIFLVGWMALFLLVNVKLTKKKMEYDLERSQAETKATGILADTVTNQENVKLFGGYKREVSTYETAVERVKQIRLKGWTFEMMVDAVQALLGIFLEIGIFYVAIRLWQNGVLTVGDFVLIQSYIFTIIGTIWGFGRTIRYLLGDITNANEMTEVLETPHEISDKPNAKPLRVKEGEIVFKNVFFLYHSTRPVIRDLSLRIKPRERVAFVGHSGAGKSTMVKLLLRMHNVTKGKVLIDGKNIANVTLESLNNAVSLVPQNPILFHRTLMENIRYGKPDASDEEVYEAARLAHCEEFISSLPEKYDTMVGERGVKLSGGERQRVAIARAILKNSPILVLDEATSSLDSESERLIQDALEVLMQGKTVISIAHRLSTIMKMDRIVVLDNGQVVEEGSHFDLLQKKDGVYRNLWDLQVGGFIE